MSHTPGRGRVFCLALVASLLAARAQAEDGPALATLLGDPTTIQHVIGAARRSMVIVNNPCASAQFAILGQPTVYDPVAFDAAGRPTKGAWKQPVSAKGCGTTRLLNVLSSVGSTPGALEVFPILPGTTHADALLQKDAVRYAVIASGPQEKGCRTRYVYDTTFLRTAGENHTGTTKWHERPWDELWTIATCTRKAQVTMHFVPDATGTGIVTNLAETTFGPLRPDGGSHEP